MTGIFSIIVLFFVWSLAFPLGKMMLGCAPPIFLTAIRMLFAAGLLVGYALLRNKIGKLSRRIILGLFLLGFFNIYLTNILEFWSLSQISAAKTCFLYSLSPFLTAILSYFHFKEKMTFMKGLGLSIGFLGFIPTIINKDFTELSLNGIFVFSWPEISMFFAVFFSVYGWILLRILVKDQVSPLVANGLSMLIGGVLALMTSFYLDSWNPTPVAHGTWPTLLGLIVVLTIVSNIFCYNLYGFLLKRYTATFLSLFGLLSPVFASLHSWILLGEVPSLPIFTSTGIVILGLFIVYKEEVKQGYIENA